jgi:TPR repeat protein
MPVFELVLFLSTEVLGMNLDALRKAAKNGDAEAQCELGFLYCCGGDIPKDYQEAIKWYVRAAKQNSARAQSGLGDMFIGGLGLPQSCEDAVKWWRKAAEQGYADAQVNLSNAYFSGDGVDQDGKEALRWLRKAAGQGHRFALHRLRELYSEGDGVPQDYAEAYAFNAILLECDDWMAEDRPAFTESMTPSQIRKGKNLAREYAKKIKKGLGI